MIVEGKLTNCIKEKIESDLHKFTSFFSLHLILDFFLIKSKVFVKIRLFSNLKMISVFYQII